MPKIRALSEFNRNQNGLIEELQESREPIYLTRNGASCLVVMDAEAFDSCMAFRNSVYAREMSLTARLVNSFQEVLDRKIVPAEEVDRELEQAMGWA